MGFVALQGHFDRNWILPMHIVLSWCQEMRASALAVHPTFTKWQSDPDSSSSFVVKAQVGRFLKEVKYQPFPKKTFKIEQYFEQVGKTSFRCSYIIYEDEMIIARVITAIVNTQVSASGARAPALLPKYVASEITWLEKDSEGSKLLAIIPRALASTSDALSVPSSSTAVVEHFKREASKAQVALLPVYPVIVRYSDEDTNHHTNHAVYVKFIEDHLQATQLPPAIAMWIEYMKESRANDRLEVRFISVGESFGSVFEVVAVGKLLGPREAKEELLCRAWCAHDVAHLSALTTDDFFLEGPGQTKKA